MDLTDSLVKLDINDLLNCLNEQPVKIQKEFKSFVSNTINTRRSSSSIISMRDFHNWIKRTMLSNISNLFNSKIKVLDIACGRGGDIDKWNNSNIALVFAFDVNEESINSVDPFNPGSKKRLSEYSKKINCQIIFDVGSATRPTVQLLNKIEMYGPYQIVSCQFALHYFFEKRDYLELVIRIISKYLVSGGFFIGTTIDGTKIRKLKEYNAPLFDISIEKNFHKNPYGNKYTFKIKDSFDEGNYFNTVGASTEYLVDFDELTKICAKYSIFPVNKNFFESYKVGNKTEYTIGPNVLPFTDILGIGKWKSKIKEMTNEELQLNDLYSTFIFIKK